MAIAKPEATRCLSQHRQSNLQTSECGKDATYVPVIRTEKLRIDVYRHIDNLCLDSYQALRQRDFDVIIGERVVSDRNLGCAILIKHKILSVGEIKVCLLLVATD